MLVHVETGADGSWSKISCRVDSSAMTYNPDKMFSLFPSLHKGCKRFSIPKQWKDQRADVVVGILLISRCYGSPRKFFSFSVSDDIVGSLKKLI